MTDRVFVQVVGFSDEERHALNTWFRMSQQHDGGYVVWDASAPVPAALALLDGDSYAAQFEMASPRTDKSPKVIWVGNGAPPGVWLCFTRPLDWPSIVAATDANFGFQSSASTLAADGIDFDLGDSEGTGGSTAVAALDGGLDIDLDLGAASAEIVGNETGAGDCASDTQPAGEAPAGKRVLVIAPSLDDRLYLRARLALAGLTQMDEATSAEVGWMQSKAQEYTLVVIDLDLPDKAGWQALVQLRMAHPQIANIVAISSRRGYWARFQTRRAGASVVLNRPLDPRKVFETFKKI